MQKIIELRDRCQLSPRPTLVRAGCYLQKALFSNGCIHVSVAYHLYREAHFKELKRTTSFVLMHNSEWVRPKAELLVKMSPYDRTTLTCMKCNGGDLKRFVFIAVVLSLLWCTCFDSIFMSIQSEHIHKNPLEKWSTSEWQVFSATVPHYAFVTIIFFWGTEHGKNILCNHQTLLLSNKIHRIGTINRLHKPKQKYADQTKNGM